MRRKLHTKELQHLYSSPNTVRVPKCRMRYKRPQFKLKDNIDMDLKEIWYESMDWIKQA
jgi:hypothetical protein